MSGREVSCEVTNTGKLAGAEVSQLYLTYPESAGQPIKQLRGFAKTVLKPGERQMVTFRLSDRWLSNWDVATHSWKLATGEFKVGVGGSSDDLPLQGTLTVG